MHQAISSDTWGLPLPAGVSVRTNIDKNAVVVHCQGRAQKEALFSRQHPGLPTDIERICGLASLWELEYLALYTGHDMQCMAIDLLRGAMETEVREGYPILGDSKVMDFLGKSLKHGSSFGIVRMVDHRSLFSSSNIGKFSKCGDAKNMFNKDVSRYWPPEELSRYVTALDEHRLGLTEFQYCARTFEDELKRFTVNARLWWFRGELVRLTETLHSEAA